MPTGPIIKEGFPLIGAMLIITVVLGFLGHYVIAIISFILALFFVNFFRNPKRVIPQDPELIYGDNFPRGYHPRTIRD